MSDQLSGPEYDMRVEEDVSVQMPDGVTLAADIYRPDAAGEFPALLTMHPYGKQIEQIDVPPFEMGDGGSEFVMMEASNSEYWAERGYVHVIVDVRGVGNSEGAYRHLMSDQEADDGYQVVEWIADQSWCDDNVGMVGTSYLAFIQYRVAVRQPPHLEAIFPHDGWADTYRDIMYHGGIQSTFYKIRPEIPATELECISRELYSEDELESRIEQLAADEQTNLMNHPVLLNHLLFPDADPFIFDLLVNREDNEFYRGRRPADEMDQIDVPTYLGSEFHTSTTCMHLPGAANWGWKNIDAPTKLAFRESVPRRPFVDFHEEMLRWFDHHLKDIDTGIMDEEPVKIWVRGAEEYRYADEWPLERDTDWERFHLRAGGGLSQNPVQSAEPPTELEYEANPPGAILRNTFVGTKPDHLTFRTEPFDDDVEIIGPIALNLYAALSADDGHFIVVFKDITPDGSSKTLSRGWLKASHRELDEEKSEPWRPYHPHTDPEPVTPGDVNKYAIEIQPIANRFAKGHRMALEIWPQDYPHGAEFDETLLWGRCHHIPFGEDVTYEIHHDSLHPSHLLVPIIED